MSVKEKKLIRTCFCGAVEVFGGLTRLTKKQEVDLHKRGFELSHGFLSAECMAKTYGKYLQPGDLDRMQFDSCPPKER